MAKASMSIVFEVHLLVDSKTIKSFETRKTIGQEQSSGVDPSVFWVFEHPHNFGRWCSPVSEHPQIFFLRICAFYQQMVCTCKVYIC